MWLIFANVRGTPRTFAFVSICRQRWSPRFRLQHIADMVSATLVLYDVDSGRSMAAIRPDIRRDQGGSCMEDQPSRFVSTPCPNAFINCRYMNSSKSIYNFDRKQARNFSASRSQQHNTALLPAQTQSDRNVLSFN